MYFLRNFCVFIIIFFSAIGLNNKNAFSSDEAEISFAARLNLRRIGDVQDLYFDEHGEYYPPSSGCTNNICWNTPSMIGSTADITNLATYYSRTFYSYSAYLSEGDGDVRYRCRRQGSQVFCFVYRCEQAEPAGCKQKWRIEYNVKYNGDGDLDVKCVDVGSADTLWWP
jgi:hypothetical protein